MKVKTVKTISMLDVLYELQRRECEELGIENHPPGTSFSLPDGRDNIKQRLWDEISDTIHGNQRFANDSLFMMYVDEDGGEFEFSDDVLKMRQLCRDNGATNICGAGAEYIVFDTSW